MRPIILPAMLTTGIELKSKLQTSTSRSTWHTLSTTWICYSRLSSMSFTRMLMLHLGMWLRRRGICLARIAYSYRLRLQALAMMLDTAIASRVGKKLLMD